MRNNPTYSFVKFIEKKPWGKFRYTPRRKEFLSLRVIILVDINTVFKLVKWLFINNNKLK